MKIMLLGYGKMGKAIEEVALKRGHKIVAKWSEGSDNEIVEADVALEFSTPDAAFNNISRVVDAAIPVVCGTTGWLSRYDEVVDAVRCKGGAFLYASNFSIGVNIFFELNRKLSAMMALFDNYEVSIEETHHIHKKDAPSGTAITLAKDIVAHTDKDCCFNPEDVKSLVPIKSNRIDEISGIHKVLYNSSEDSIEIRHTAHSRKGFALGAVLAAEWIYGKSGIFSMKDVLSEYKL